MTDLTHFTNEVRTFLAESLTPELKRAGELCAGIYADQPIALEWHRILHKQGWSVPSWPVEFGGTGWNLEQHAIFQRELTLASAPVITPNSTRMVGAVVIAFGTEEQKAHYLPRIRSGEDWWAQGYSEPGAGSDLASLQCKAVREGEHYIINGTKIWTTHAQWSNKIFCLVRTDNTGKHQQGITFLLFDIDLPGIEVRPLISISGDHEFNQVFFDNVRVPISGLLGEENDGWTVAKYLLQHERGGSYGPGLKTSLDLLKSFANQEANGALEPLISNASFSQKIAEAEIALSVLESFEQKTFSAVNSGQPVGSISSAIKIRGTEMRQRITELTIEAVGYYGFPYQPDARAYESNLDPIGSPLAATAMPQYLNDRAASIYAGSNEIQRNIITKAVLGL
ncbi:MAG: acyl-CoA dehydrogenase family protein [Parvibaculaceae bacterium]|nr:acyl-CoA dehydrogenase family protein [Parvibaculaceae bacterium]